MIADFLLIGKENAQTARDLANLLECEPRDITTMIERERRQGAPIVASCDSRRPGYYLTTSAEELRQYCDSLHRRAGEIYKTRAALLEIADNLPSNFRYK